MKFKLKDTEFIALYDIFQNLSHRYSAEGMEDKLLHVMATEIFIKLYKQAIYKKPKYTVKLSEAEAISFWLLMNDHEFPNTSHAGNLLNIINNEIYQQFAQPHWTDFNPEKKFYAST